LCGECSPHARHCVSYQTFAHPGHSPRVQNVFQTVPQAGVHIQRSCGPGRQPHLGQ
jgi:hypothetical protein